jgi:prepilin-type N-terminal cleavage/methylation domain-containing protein
LTRRRGFTLLEVVVASALLGVVGLATLAFLSAFAQGAAARSRISDPALEGTLALERLRALAPQLRCTLGTRDDLAALWLSDNVPSRSVHLSELGWVRFDSEAGDVLLERIDPVALATDRELETAFARDEDFLAVRDDALRAGILTSAILAEGLSGVAIIAAKGGAPVELQFETESASARIALSPIAPEEPLR